MVYKVSSIVSYSLIITILITIVIKIPCEHDDHWQPIITVVKFSFGTKFLYKAANIAWLHVYCC
jgi:hypothetical protein